MGPFDGTKVERRNMTAKSRPDIVDGKSTKMKVGCGNLYISVNFNDDGKPFEVFLNGSKLGGCRANQEGLSRLATLCLKHDVPLEEVMDQLQLIVCPACTRAKAKLTDQEAVKVFPTSCPDAVAKALDKLAQSYNKTKK